MEIVKEGHRLPEMTVSAENRWCPVIANLDNTINLKNEQVYHIRQALKLREVINPLRLCIASLHQS